MIKDDLEKTIADLEAEAQKIKDRAVRQHRPMNMLENGRIAMIEDQIDVHKRLLQRVEK